MQHFSEEELQELELLFGLKRNKDVLVVRDGIVDKDMDVWWRSLEGPQLVAVYSHWDNIALHPQVYQVTKPQVSVTYLDPGL